MNENVCDMDLVTKEDLDRLREDIHGMKRQLDLILAILKDQTNTKLDYINLVLQNNMRR